MSESGEAGRYLKTRGIVLDRRPAGEHHLRLDLLSPEDGAILCLLRPSRKHPGAQPALFDEAELALERPRKGGSGYFVREYRPLRRHPGIAASYRALTEACALAAILRANLDHTEDFAAVGALLEKALGGYEKNLRPEACTLKSLYLYARQEGYPVREGWRAGLPEGEASALEAVLREPLEEQSTPPAQLAQLRQALETWLERETDIRISR